MNMELRWRRAANNPTPLECHSPSDVLEYRFVWDPHNRTEWTAVPIEKEIPIPVKVVAPQPQGEN